MNKGAAVVLALLIAGSAGSYGYYYYNIRALNSDSAAAGGLRVFAASVRSLSDHADSSGRIQRYGGEIEPQTTWSATREPDQEIEKTYVEVGDEVKVGTKLFTYDRSALENSLEQKDIDIEKKQIELISEKKALEDDKRSLNTIKTAEERAELTISIAQQENTIKSDEFDIKQKQIERDKIEASLKNTDVYSEMAGIVRSISVSSGNSNSDSDTYITIMAEGDFRVKAKLNEQNVSEVALGDKMLVYSRAVESRVYAGTVTEMDTFTTQSDSENSSYYSFSGSSDSALSATNYSFYVTLGEASGLLLGEHVYLEKDEGQLEKREGIWLDEAYLVPGEDGMYYVWAETARHSLELRLVVPGEYDALLGRYEITSGLTMEDYIAYPMDYMKEGQAVTRVDYEAAKADDGAAELDGGTAGPDDGAAEPGDGSAETDDGATEDDTEA